MCAGIVACFAIFHIPQYQGERMAAVGVLLMAFGLAALPLTYLLSFLFRVGTPPPSLDQFAKSDSVGGDLAGRQFW